MFYKMSGIISGGFILNFTSDEMNYVRIIWWVVYYFKKPKITKIVWVKATKKHKIIIRQSTNNLFCLIFLWMILNSSLLR